MTSRLTDARPMEAQKNNVALTHPYHEKKSSLVKFNLVVKEKMNGLMGGQTEVPRRRQVLRQGEHIKIKFLKVKHILTINT